VIVAAAIAAALVALYMLWFRDSSLVAVDEVEVEGVTVNREEITTALEDAGMEMTTLHIDEEELREAASEFPTIASVRAEADLPGKLRIIVTERLPVARVRLGGDEVVVSEEGLVLPGVVSERKLPRLESAGVEAGRLDEEGVAQAVILGAAPAQISDRLRASEWDPERGGVVVELEGVPELRFGDGERAEAKWQAATAVLADPEGAPSGYVDVSVPERPVGA